MAKTIVLVFVFLLLAAAGTTVWMSRNGSSESETFVVYKGTIRRSARGSGRVEGMSETTLMFPVAGRLNKVHIKEGADVPEFENLAELNIEEVDVRIAQADQELKQAQAKLQQVSVNRSTEEIEQAKEKLMQETDGIKSLTARLNALEHPPIPPPASPQQIQTQYRAIEMAQQFLVQRRAELKKIKAGPTKDDIAIAELKYRNAESEWVSAEDRYTGAEKPAIFLDTSSKQLKSELKSKAEIAKANRDVALAEWEKIKRPPPQEDIDVAVSRERLAQIELDSAIETKRNLENPVAPPPAPAHEIEAAKMLLQQAQSRERFAKLEVQRLEHWMDSPEVKAEISAAEAGVAKAKKSLELVNLNKQAMTLRAPFAGTILRRLVEPGVVVTPGTPIVSIVDFSQKRVRAEFDVGRLLDIKQGMQVELTSRALGKDALDGKVEKILGVGTRKLHADDPAAPRGGEVLEVIISIEEPKSDLKKKAYDALRPGLRMDADVTLEKADNVIVAKTSFVPQENGNEYVLRLDRPSANGTTEQPKNRNVVCGLRDESFVEIKHGLEEGDVIVKPKPQNTR
jgi:multidrug resistance efflux pump